MAKPLPLRLYGAAVRAVAPLGYLRAERRLARAGVPPERRAERRGFATSARPEGPLAWFHGASVGETLSLLPLAEALAGAATILVTGGTVAAAALLAKRLPEGALHQYAPLDTPGAVGRFLDHWRPGIAVFAESEIWPVTIEAAAARHIPLALVGARLSDRSLARWARAPATARHLFGRFALIAAQDARTRDGLAPFVADPARLRLAGNLKAAAAPLPHDPEALALWRERLADRPLWVASSTHNGEDAPVLDAHAHVLAGHPAALLILVPRHPERGPEIARIARERGLATARLGAGDPVTGKTRALVADTMGELGLWYRLAPLVFLAGSFGSAGGHNPWEPVRLGAALLHGPNVPNAARDYARLHAAGAALEVADGAALGRAVARLLGDPAALACLRDAANGVTGGAETLVHDLAAELRALLGTG